MPNLPRLHLLTACLLAWTVTAGAAETLASPDGRLIVSVAAGGPLTWNLAWQGRTVIAAGSRLGLAVQGQQAFSGPFTIADRTETSHDERWKPVCGERSVVTDRYRGLVLHLTSSGEPARRLDLELRAYDGGIAFRYVIPPQPGLGALTITGEDTTFAFTEDHRCWPVYAAQGDYDDPGKCPALLSQVASGAERPLTIRLADDRWAAITEAGLVDFARMKLRPAGAKLTLGVLLDGEKNQAGSVVADVSAKALATPWRVVMVATSPGGLLEGNDLVLNLNEPCAIADTSWIRPGKVMRETTLTTVGAKAVIDFCAAQRMQYLLFDAGWYGHEYDDRASAKAVDVDPKRNPNKGPLDLKEVIAYGASKDVGVILYVNRRALERELDEILPLYASWGVKGVKYGFVNVGSQRWTSWLHGAIRKAAEHRLMVDIHDEFRSTGYQRTYPNLMTCEGVLGNEGFPSVVHNATLPFTRYLTGPADYTFCWSIPRLKPSHAHQLALTVIYYSPWQVLYWYDRPAGIPPGPEQAFWRDLPTTWDETRVLGGRIGQEAVIARRQGTDWYIGAIHPEGRAQVAVPLAFLDPARRWQATVYRDANPDDPAAKAVAIDRQAVDSTTTLTIDIPAHGGAAIQISAP